MLCPNCGMKQKGDYCIHCGYMSNGNFIDTKKKIEAPLLEMYLGKKYDTIIRNNNFLVPGILGPVYIFCHKFYFVGIILILIDFLVSIFFLVLNHAFLFYYIVEFYNYSYWIINKIVWATIGNMIYVKLLIKKIDKFKEKNPTDYKEKIEEQYKKDTKLLKTKYVLFGLIFYFLFMYFKSIVYNWLGLI